MKLNSIKFFIFGVITTGIIFSVISLTKKHEAKYQEGDCFYIKVNYSQYLKIVGKSEDKYTIKFCDIDNLRNLAIRFGAQSAKEICFEDDSIFQIDINSFDKGKTPDGENYPAMPISCKEIN